MLIQDYQDFSGLSNLNSYILIQDYYDYSRLFLGFQNYSVQIHFRITYDYSRVLMIIKCYPSLVKITKLNFVYDHPWLFTSIRECARLFMIIDKYSGLLHPTTLWWFNVNQDYSIRIHPCSHWVIGILRDYSIEIPSCLFKIFQCDYSRLLMVRKNYSFKFVYDYSWVFTIIYD